MGVVPGTVSRPYIADHTTAFWSLVPSKVFRAFQLGLTYSGKMPPVHWGTPLVRNVTFADIHIEHADAPGVFDREFLFHHHLGDGSCSKGHYAVDFRYTMSLLVLSVTHLT